MNPAQVLDHFDRICDAPDAIPRLRRFILDLAVRGKLVEQDPNDEPASQLLKRIQAEKARLLKEGKIRKPKILDDRDDEDGLFRVPSLWKWCRLSEVGAIVGGGTPPSADADNFTRGGSGIAWLTPADLGKQTDLYVSHGARDLTEQGLRSSSATLMPKGSVLFTSRAPIGYTAIAANEISTNQGFKSVVPYILACNLYIAVYFRAFGKWIDGKASGTTFREVSGKIVANLPLPLPPLAEQQRIVAKLDELMALCDRLEAVQTERETRRDRVAASSLHRLNNGADADEFREHSRFYLRHLPRLTTRPEHIQQLRQAILNLAVRGKLVPQDPNDELASALLKRIQAERERLVSGGQIKKNKSRRTSSQGKHPFVLPSSWVWIRLEDVMPEFQNGESSRGDTGGKLTVVLRLADIKEGQVSLSDIRKIPIDQRSARKYQLSAGDILVVRVNGSADIVGRFVVCAQEIHGIYCDHFIRMRIRDAWFTPAFLGLLGASTLIREQIADLFVTTAGQKTINQGHIGSLLVPLVPLAEQHRIVAKVDELMALCDRLEAQLTTTQSESRRLLEAVLNEALNGDA